ncbi:hypothetical protein KW790_00810 [Candidatus Parcubacteria bacterium]|nr:hypothetical protein [Candidatus Parcubacteria bacterium]
MTFEEIKKKDAELRTEWHCEYPVPRKKIEEAQTLVALAKSMKQNLTDKSELSLLSHMVARWNVRLKNLTTSESSPSSTFMQVAG